MPSSASKQTQGDEIQDSNDEDSDEAAHFKTPVGNKHVVFEDDENEEFVTPLESHSRDATEAGLGKGEVLTVEQPRGENQAQEEDGNDEDLSDDDDDDDDAPEAISSHAAKVQNEDFAHAATKAAQK